MFNGNYFSREVPSSCICGGISYEYLPGWPEPAEKEIIRLCLYHTRYLHRFLKLYISQTKKSLNSKSRRVTRAGRGGGLPCPFSKFKEKCPDFGEKKSLLGSSMGLTSQLKCCFKRI